MEFQPLEESKTRLVFQLKGETHTFCNLLKDELQQAKGVVMATYKIDHPDSAPYYYLYIIRDNLEIIKRYYF